MEIFISANSSMPWIFLFFVFIFGTIWGSFLNVVIYRLPLDKSVIFPSSRCACGEKIPFYFNIPVLSWFILSGQAHCCEKTISLRYPLVETLTGILFLLLWLEHDWQIALVGMGFFALLITAAFIDLDHMIIPDILSIGGLAIGIFVSLLIPELHGLSSNTIRDHWYSLGSALFGVIVGTSLVYWIATFGELILKKPAMGEGDMKFLAAIGAFTGWQGAVFSLFGGAFIGTLLIVPYMIFQRIKDPEKPRLEALPFGPFLALGAILQFLYLEQIVQAYFAQLTLLF